MLNNYTYPIETAALHFLLISILLTSPYILFNYIKYGSVSKWRSFILFTFFYYLLSAYYLVILPLPDPNTFTAWTNPPMQLVPFAFVNDFITQSGFNLFDHRSYLPALASSTFLEPILNIIMVLPFGVYLQYYFGQSFKQTLLLSFLLTLFFELTQLSGLYGIYPHAYRLFDVDDLSMNTLGGALGWLAAEEFLGFLPNRERIDQVNIEKSAKVGYIRRIFGFVIDNALVLIVAFIVEYFLGKDFQPYYFWLNLVLLAAYLVIAQWVFGTTVGKRLVHISLARTKQPGQAEQSSSAVNEAEEGREGKGRNSHQRHPRPPLPRILLRYSLLFAVIVIATLIFGYLNNLVETTEENGIYALMQLGLLLLLCVDPVVNLWHGKLLVYERLSGLKNVSTKTAQRTNMSR